jgi:hypothetical protein
MAYQQARNRRKKLEKTYEATKNSYGSGVWFDERKNRYIKCTASNTPGYAKLLRRISNKKVRKAAEIGNYSAYRKCFDYWWELY